MDLARVVSIADIESMDDYCSVSLAAKAIQMHDRVQVKSVLEKQDVTLSDQSSTIKLTLWQSDIGF